MGRDADRMLARLRDAVAGYCTLPDDTELRRTFAGSRQRNEGAWSWFALSPTVVGSTDGKGRDVGSQYPMRVLLGCRNWLVSTTSFGIHVDPCDECIAKFGRVRF